jgi:hypothetical protein
MGRQSKWGVLPSRLRPLSTGRPAGEAEDFGGVLCEHAIPAQVPNWANGRVNIDAGEPWATIGRPPRRAFGCPLSLS